MRMGRNRVAALCVAALCAALPASGAAEAMKGRGLLAACSGSEGAAGQAFCNGYLAGFADGLGLGGALVLMNGAGLSSAAEIDAAMERYTGICMGPGAAAGALSDDLAAWLEARPEALDKDAGLLVVQALHDLYRCAE